MKVSIISPRTMWATSCPCARSAGGEFKDMQYLDTNLVEIHYHMPLNEIIYDFFDALKARTKGYASLDYEFLDYRPSDLVKVDLLLNGEQVDALSFIVHREKAYGRARKICEKLKENIPPPALRGPRPGGHRRQDHRPGDRQGHAQGTCWPSATAATSAEKKKLLEKQKEGKKEDAYVGNRAVAYRGLHGCAEAG